MSSGAATSNRMHHVVEQMVFITQLEAGLLSTRSVEEVGIPLHVSELLMAAVNLARRFTPRNPDVSVRVDVRDEHAVVLGEPNALKHALAEIIANGLGFSPTASSLVLWTRGRAFHRRNLKRPCANFSKSIGGDRSSRAWG